MAATFHLDILAASVPFYRGDCVSLVIPTQDGEIGVLAGHCNAVGAVCAGELRFETAEDMLPAEDTDPATAATPPAFCALATTCNARVVFPDDS